MRFYRLEKLNYIKYYGYALLKGLGISILATVILALCMGYQFMIVSSGSMTPTLPVGSLVVVAPCEYDDLKLGDIVTMNKGGVYLTHRIVGKKDINNNIIAKPGEAGFDEKAWNMATWYTQGDASNTADGKLQDHQVVGVVNEYLCFTVFGKIVTFIRYLLFDNRIALVMVIALGAVICFMLSYLRKLLRPKDDIECYDNDDE